MALQHSFDPHTFLRQVGLGRTTVSYRKQSPIFAQGDAADAVYYIQDGQVKLTVVSARGKEAVIAMLGAQAFFGEGCLRDGVKITSRFAFTEGLPSSSILGGPCPRRLACAF